MTTKITDKNVMTHSLHSKLVTILFRMPFLLDIILS